MLGILGVLVVGGGVYFTQYHPTTSPVPGVVSGTETRFTGIISGVSDQSASDGPISIRVSEKTVIIGGGLGPDGPINGSTSGLNRTDLQANVGKKVEVYAERADPQDQNIVSIVSNSKYYLRVVP